jgi:hypothetical protein
MELVSQSKFLEESLGIWRKGREGRGALGESEIRRERRAENFSSHIGISNLTCWQTRSNPTLMYYTKPSNEIYIESQFNQTRSNCINAAK